VYRETREAIAAVRDAVTAVEAGECVVVYPEGTISKDPNLWPMVGKTGAARIALVTGRPVIPMAQWGACDVMRPYRKEFKILPRKTMHVWAGEPVDLSDLADRPLDHETLDIATDRIMQAMTELLEGIRGEQAPTERFSPVKARREARELAERPGSDSPQEDR
jgi:1-acyl-sn-glycerol-3-phosphate acyltransferase